MKTAAYFFRNPFRYAWSNILSWEDSSLYEFNKSCCSNVRDSSRKGFVSNEKNSERLILNPLHIFSRVTTVGQVWRLNMLLRLEYARLDSLASLYSVQCLKSSNCCILFNTSCSIIYITHFRLLYVIVIILKNNT